MLNCGISLLCNVLKGRHASLPTPTSVTSPYIGGGFLQGAGQFGRLLPLPWPLWHMRLISFPSAELFCRIISRSLSAYVLAFYFRPLGARVKITLPTIIPFVLLPDRPVIYMRRKKGGIQRRIDESPSLNSTFQFPKAKEHHISKIQRSAALKTALKTRARHRF